MRGLTLLEAEFLRIAKGVVIQDVPYGTYGDAALSLYHTGRLRLVGPTERGIDFEVTAEGYEALRLHEEIVRYTGGPS